ncbi:hypothetical protein [Treponema bryantii]|uniref:hypothetical protein n=1 Tax=Treponema bryantii TaxID=163 RepID=UPI002B29AB7B|nr:hypothetical protein TRBR_13150 [Treponema bryantii]
MKKIISLLFIHIIILSFIYSAEVFFRQEGDLEGLPNLFEKFPNLEELTSSIDNPHYILELSCENAKSCFYKDGLYYIKSGETIFVNYKQAELSELYGESLSLYNSSYTYLKIQREFDTMRCGEEIFNNSFTIDQDYSYIITLCCGYIQYGTSILPKELIKVKIQADSTPPSQPLLRETASDYYVSNSNLIIRPYGSEDADSGFAYYDYDYYDYKLGYKSKSILLNCRWDNDTLYIQTDENQDYKGVIELKAVDNVGNFSTTLVQILIDKTAPVISADKPENTWTNEDITVNIIDATSSVYGECINESRRHSYEKISFDNNQAVINEPGCWHIYATDGVKNSAEAIFLVDKTLPYIIIDGVDESQYSYYLESSYWKDTWNREFSAPGHFGGPSPKTHCSIWGMDDDSGISSLSITKDGITTVLDTVVTQTQEIDGYFNYILQFDPRIEYKIEESGEYIIRATDIAGNSKEITLRIDAVPPEIQWPEEPFTNFSYIEKDETKYLDCFYVNSVVKDNLSGVDIIDLAVIDPNNAIFGGNWERLDEKVKVRNISGLIPVYWKRRVNQEPNIIRKTDYEIKCVTDAKDNAGNHSESIPLSLTLPRIINIKPVEKDDKQLNIRRSYITEDGYTKVGLIINNINFDLYKEIILKRTFLGDQKDGESERIILTYEDYKAKFANNVDEKIIKEKWEAAEKTIITKNDVREVVIDGQSYWYYEDKIETSSGLGHRGIRYQPEWTWKALDITERGNYSVIDKTANAPGNVKIRIQGTNEDGSEKRYMVLDSNGNKIENECDKDFLVPESGLIGIAFKIEDDDFDDYSVQTTEVIKVSFDGQESEITVASENPVSEGYIEKISVNNKVNLESRYTKNSDYSDGWHEFENSEIKLYYNKPYNMKITMTEGCKGNNGAFKDVTESGVISLQASGSDFGGFKLLVGKEAGYNMDGITARPHQAIKLGIEVTSNDGNPYEIEWDFGDGTTKETKNEIVHKYKQSPYRTGNTSEYKLKINLKEKNVIKTAQVNVYIVDTQVGILLGNEEWIGKHPVLGKIQVGKDTTLTIIDNNEKNNNPTEILCIGSPIEERKGGIEVLYGGCLKINCKNVIIGEGKNGNDFTRIQTEKEGSNEESLKWDGIKIRSGACKSEICNATIEYAVTGIDIEDKSTISISNTVIKNCMNYGIENSGIINSANKIEIDNCANGINIKQTGSVSGENLQIKNVQNAIVCKGNIETKSINLNNVENCSLEGNGTIKTDCFISDKLRNGLIIEKNGNLFVNNYIMINESESGIQCEGSISAGSINLTKIKNVGIKLSGKLTTNSEIILEGNDGITGFENLKGAEFKSNKNIYVSGFKEGIKNLGNIRVTDKISTENTKKYGVRNEGYIKAGTLKILTENGRGYICGSGSEANFNNTQIKAEEIGIHCIGTAVASFGNTNVKTETYGIKTDRDKNGSPTIKFPKCTIENAFVLWYDWKDGVLTDEEIQKKIENK